MWIEITTRRYRILRLLRHPPCEDVDWNIGELEPLFVDAVSSSVWGCGLKFKDIYIEVVKRMVILRVRMWIEIRFAQCKLLPRFVSSSVWGCGLKSSSPLMTTTASSVILRVRMWIEILINATRSSANRVILRVRMWIEIGMKMEDIFFDICHPPCEDVDWNISFCKIPSGQFSSSSVWGCGLK